MGLVEQGLKREGVQSFSWFWSAKAKHIGDENRLCLPYRSLTFPLALHPPSAPAPFPFLVVAATSVLDPKLAALLCNSVSENQSQKHISLTPLSSPIASPGPSRQGSETVLIVAAVSVGLQTALPQDSAGDPGQSERPTMRTRAHTHSCTPASTTVGCRQAWSARQDVGLA